MDPVQYICQRAQKNFYNYHECLERNGSSGGGVSRLVLMTTSSVCIEEIHTYMWEWRDCSVVKSLYGSCRRPELVPSTCGGSQSSISPVAEDLMPTSDLHGYWACT